MNNLSCDIVTDLLPLYVDHLTAPESEKQIKEHLAACESCRKVYEQMTAGEPKAKKETRKVDVFKKIKKSHLKAVFSTVKSKALVTSLVNDSFPNDMEQSAGGSDKYDITTITIPVAKNGTMVFL